jgi:hypothetical protein
MAKPEDHASKSGDEPSTPKDIHGDDAKPVDSAPAKEDGKTPEADHSPALAAAVGLVVAGLAAVGVSGGVLVRAVRDQPALMAGCVSAALAIGAIATMVALRRLSIALIVALLAVTSIFTVLVGAASLDERAQPSISLGAVAHEGYITVTVEASTTGLRSSEDMLVQLQAISRPLPKKSPKHLSAIFNRCDVSRLNRKQRARRPGPLLAWHQIGSDSEGNAETTFSVDIERGDASGVCGYAIDGNRTNGGELDPSHQQFGEEQLDAFQESLGLTTGKETRSSIAYLRLPS